MSNSLQIQMIAPKLLKASSFNANIVSPSNEAKLEESIRRNGMFKPALVRELSDGTMEIIGGEHRVLAAVRLNIESIPIVNLGKIDDKRAKEICLLDNSRYGNDDALQLADLLEGLGTADEIASFMPYSELDIASIFSSVNIALDELDLPDNDEEPQPPPSAKPAQTTQVLRFKVQLEDVGKITSLIEKTMKLQKFTESDSLTNAGDALVYLLNARK